MAWERNFEAKVLKIREKEGDKRSGISIPADRTSSKSKMDAREYTARARDTRAFCPPDKLTFLTSQHTNQLNCKQKSYSTLPDFSPITIFEYLQVSYKCSGFQGLRVPFLIIRKIEQDVIWTTISTWLSAWPQLIRVPLMDAFLSHAAWGT
jgi:hypothetical protein